MDFRNRLNAHAAKVQQQAAAIKTEEATKTAFIMPFIHTVLGYDVFDPSEVVPEYVCDVGTKKGEKIDYAILHGGEVQILIESKKIGEPLNINHASQLFLIDVKRPKRGQNYFLTYQQPSRTTLTPLSPHQSPAAYVL